MRTRLIGCHHLVLPDGQCEDMAVVEFDEQGRYVSHHAMQRNGTSYVEEPFVEWQGGTIDLSL